VTASDDLARLSVRAKEAEDRAAAARGRPRPTLKRTSRRRERPLRPRPRNCANRPTRTRTSSQSGGATCSVRGTTTSRRFAKTSIARDRSTTWIGRRGTPTTPKTTRRLRSRSRMQRSRRPSTRRKQHHAQARSSLCSLSEWTSSGSYGEPRTRCSCAAASRQREQLRAATAGERCQAIAIAR
jgi:hypothetical protein